MVPIVTPVVHEMDNEGKECPETPSSPETAHTNPAESPPIAPSPIIEVPIALEAPSPSKEAEVEALV
jgi:hypothetical protein